MASSNQYHDHGGPRKPPPAYEIPYDTNKVLRIDMCHRFLPEKMPKGGAYQVLGKFPTSRKVIPPIPDWLPAKLHPQWTEIWKHRPKQYVRPFWESKKLLPWDTTHSVMGDYNGPAEYYVEGCFGYDERGQEISMRPGLPGVHMWVSTRPKPGLEVVLPIWYGDKEQNPPALLFDFHTAGKKFSKTELEDIGIKNVLSLQGPSKVSLPEPATIPDLGKNEQLPQVFISGVDGNILQVSCSEQDTAVGSCGTTPVSNISRYSSKSSIESGSSPESFVTRYPTAPVASCKSKLEFTTVHKSLCKASAGSNRAGRKSALTIPTSPVKQALVANSKANLLAIPGEVRNHIFGYLFKNTSTYHITWCSRGKDLTHLVHRLPIDVTAEDLCFLRQASKDSSMFTIPLQDTKATTLRRHQMKSIYIKDNQAERPQELQASGSTAILMTCKQTYLEATPLFYAKHAFTFDSRAILHKFMNSLSEMAMSSITHLYLSYSPQGNPWKTKDAVLVQKERSLWMKDLKHLVSNFTHLQNFSLLLTIRDAHINNTDRADWAMALRRGLAGLKSHSHFVYFDLNIELGDESSLLSRLPRNATRSQMSRCEDLGKLAQLIKKRIWEDIEVDGNGEVIAAKLW